MSRLNKNRNNLDEWLTLTGTSSVNYSRKNFFVIIHFKKVDRGLEDGLTDRAEIYWLPRFYFHKNLRGTISTTKIKYDHMSK